MTKYAIIYERAGDGTWSALIPDLPGVWSVGKTIPQARANVLDAAALWINVHLEQGDELPDRSHKVEEIAIAASGGRVRAPLRSSARALRRAIRPAPR